MSERRSVVVVPLKSFDVAKSRLRASLSEPELHEFARELARGVIVASAPLPCVVVGDSRDVAEFAEGHGARFLFVTQNSLNGAIDESLAQLRREFDFAVLAHGDLAHPEGLGTFEFPDEMTIVTDRHGTGTNVLALPIGVAFQAQYGEGSAARHEAQGHDLGLSVRVIRDSPWALDIDDPDDYELVRAGRT